MVVDLHSLNVNNLTLPAGTCAGKVPVELRNGAGQITTNNGLYDVTPTPTNAVTFGDLDGDGRDEMAMRVVCVPHGGNGYYVQAVVMHASASATPTLVGIVNAQYPTQGVYPSMVEAVALSRGTVSVTEDFYTAADPHSTPSGRAQTVWTLTAGRLVPGVPTVISPGNSLAAGSCPSIGLVQQAVSAEQQSQGFTSAETVTGVLCSGDLIKANVVVDTGGGATQGISAFLRQNGGTLTVVVIGSAAHCSDADGPDAVGATPEQRAALGC